MTFISLTVNPAMILVIVLYRKYRLHKTQKLRTEMGFSMNELETVAILWLVFSCPKF